MKKAKKANTKKARITKKDIYAQYGIAYSKGKIYAPFFKTWISPLLVNGNKKIGKGAYHFSILPGTAIFEVVLFGILYLVKGTCKCNCPGCYAQTGNYRFPSVKKSLALKTLLVRNDLDFVKRAILAQIKADKITICRIHAAGDFDSMAYAEIWRDIATACPDTVFWTYTKVKECETIFEGLSNANIVKSIIPGRGFNFGKCGYIIALYNELKAKGYKVYICECGFNDTRKCTDCCKCALYDFVLFLEHSTDYKGKEDALYPVLKNIVENQ